MNPSVATPTRFICKICQFSRRAPQPQAFSILTRTARLQPAARCVAYVDPTHKKQRRRYATAAAIKLPVQGKARFSDTIDTATPSASNVEETLKWITHTSRDIIASETVPDDLTVLEVLIKSQELSNILVFGTPEQPEAETAEKPTASCPHTGSTSSLLELEDENTAAVYGAKARTSSALSVATRQRASSVISETIYDVLRDRKVFITPDALNLYTRIQLLLGRPQYLPAIFDQYATKPIPRAGSSPTTYSKPWKAHPKNAIDLSLSGSALDAAIAKRDLSLAIAIIETTVGTPAFRFAKVLRKALLPLAAWATLPFMAYTGADWLSHYQNTMDEDYYRVVVMLGAGGYIATTSIVGFIAITTYNDQMERVSWQPGYRLRDRWLREEERLYFDRVAMAWGFKEKWRRGEEQGEEWEALREFLGFRSMVLDKTSLLEGME